MPDLSVTYAGMESGAAAARAQQGNLEQIIAAMVQTIDSLELQGQAGSAIREAWAGARPTFVNFANLLGQYSTEIMQTSQDLEAADTAARARILASCTF